MDTNSSKEIIKANEIKDEAIGVVKEKEKEDVCVTIGAAACCGLILLLILALLGFGIAKIVMGKTYLYDCAIEPLISSYLIVSGLSPLLFGGYGCGNSEGKKSWTSLFIATFAVLFHIVWLICGSVWIYPNYGKLQDVDFKKCESYTTTGCLKNTCDKKFITFAVAAVTIDWFFVGLGIVAFAFKLKSFLKKT